MDYLTLKDRIKCYYTMKTILAYLFNKKQTSKHPNKIFYSTIASCLQETKRHRWLSATHMIIFQRCHK